MGGGPELWGQHRPPVEGLRHRAELDPSDLECGAGFLSISVSQLVSFIICRYRQTQTVEETQAQWRPFSNWGKNLGLAAFPGPGHCGRF